MQKIDGSPRTIAERHITRRQVIKAGGIAALGLAFSQPVISTIRPDTVFAAGYQPGPPSTGCCPNGVPVQDEILDQRTHDISSVAEAFMEIIGPADGTSCCNTAITLALGFRDIQSQWICDKLEQLDHDGKITIDTDGVIMHPVFNRNGSGCSLTRSIFFPIKCDSATGCQCSYNASHTTTITIPLYGYFDLKVEIDWSASVTPDSDEPCKVGVSQGNISKCISYYKVHS